MEPLSTTWPTSPTENTAPQSSSYGAASPTHPIAPNFTAEIDQVERELFNSGERSNVVEHLVADPQATQEVDPHDERLPRTTTGDRGEAVQALAPCSPAAQPSQNSTIATSLASPVQLYSPTKTEIDNHPIRQRLSVHGDHVAASGWGLRQAGDEGLDVGRQDESEKQCTEETGKMTEVKEGDKVAWNWGSGAPGGTASEVVTDGDAKMVSHRGNEVKKKGSPENPAVHIERPGNDVVKKASELEVEEKGPNHKEGGGEEEKKEEEKKDEQATNGEAKTGEKRSADEANKDEGEKKGEKTNGDANAASAAEPPKKKGRPAKGGAGASGGAAKKETKKKEPKKAATADGKPRRSGRNKA